MTPEQIDEAARALVAARKDQPIAALPEGARPQSEADSYAIQEAVLRRLGERVGGWQGMDLVHPPIAVTNCGQDFAECTGLRAGDPIGLLIDLVNHVAKARGEVPPGTFVTTGTHTGMVFTEPGARIRADYGPLGRI